MKKTILNISLFVSLVSLFSCGGSGKNPAETPVDSLVTLMNKDTTTVVFYNIPSPLETFTILKMSSNSFDKSVLNPTDKVAKYVSSFSKSVNLGAYSTDLSFCFLYKQNQEFSNYLKNVNDLTTGLGIDGSYGQAVAKRLQTNSNNLDSLMTIVSEAGVNADQYLKENQRNNTTALIAAGGWIEAMHIITAIADKSQNKDVISLVADQKIVLKNLTNMLEQFKSDPEIMSILTDLNQITAIYEGLEPVKTELAFIDNTMPSIGNNTSYNLTKEQLKSLLEKVDVLRNKLTL